MLKFNLFLWCKAEFSASLLQSWVSHDPSEIIYANLYSHSGVIISAFAAVTWVQQAQLYYAAPESSPQLYHN